MPPPRRKPAAAGKSKSTNGSGGPAPIAEAEYGRSVMIATPSAYGKPDVFFLMAMFELGRLAGANGWNVQFRARAYDALVQRARNDLVFDAMREGVDELVFIDEDQVFPAEAFQRLLNHDVDCVGFPVRRKADDETYNVKTQADGRLPVGEGGLLAVDGLGTGFLRLTRRALVALWEQAEPYRDHEGEKRWIFDVAPVDGILASEDIAMCALLKEAGIQTWLDPAVTIGHIGAKRWDGNFIRWLNERARAAQPAQSPPAL